ncbi:MAG: helix-turn-helix transcriptional regulator [Lachnospiraceae bacterium]|nr:helix-turn-helix transcriptional regulator [Lachnospiraceae bacterium]
MPVFDKDEFWLKIESMYMLARQNNYVIKLSEEEVKELKALFVDVYIPIENLGHYDDLKLIKKMMTKIVSICKIDKEPMSASGDVIQLVNSVNYDGRNMYLRYAKISPIKFRRLELGKSKKEIADRIGYTPITIDNCEEYYCDLNRQPETMIQKLASALQCEVSELF